jgi:hypothetical protein
MTVENVWCNRSFSSAHKVRHAGAGAPAGAGGIGAAAAGIGLPTPLTGTGAGGLAPGAETGAAITIGRGTSFAAGGFPMRRGDPISSMTVGRQMSVLHDGTMVIHSSTTTYGRGAGGLGLGGGSSFAMRPGPSFAATGHGLAPSPVGHVGTPPVIASPAGGLQPAAAPAGGPGTRGGYKAIPDFGAAGKSAAVAGAATTAGVASPAVEAAAVSAFTGTTAGAVEGTGAPGETTTAISSVDSSGASDDSSDSDSDTYRSGPTPLDAVAAEQHPLPVMLMAEPGSRTPRGGFRMIRKAESAPIVVHETPLLSPSDVESADDSSEGRSGSRVSTTVGVRGTDTTTDGVSSAGPSLQPASTRSVAASVPRFASPLSPPSKARLLPPTTLLPLAAPLAGAAGTVAAPGEGSVDGLGGPAGTAPPQEKLRASDVSGPGALQPLPSTVRLPPSATQPRTESAQAAGGQAAPISPGQVRVARRPPLCRGGSCAVALVSPAATRTCVFHFMLLPQRTSNLPGSHKEPSDSAVRPLEFIVLYRCAVRGPCRCR